MSEYWFIRSGFEKRAESFFQKKLAEAFACDYEIGKQDFVNAGKAAAAIKFSLKRIGVNAEILRRVAIIAYEAEINITAHANGGKIRSNIHPDLIHIIFEDYGPGMEDIEKSMLPGYSTANDLVREMGFGAGLGLPNIKKNTDVLHIISEKGKNTFLEVVVFF